MRKPKSRRLAQILLFLVIDHCVATGVEVGILVLVRIDAGLVIGEAGAQRGARRLLLCLETHGFRQPGRRLLADLGLDDALTVAQRGTGAGKVALLASL